MAFTEYLPQTVPLAIEKNSIDILVFAAEKGHKPFGIEQDISWVINKPHWPSFLFNPRFEAGSLEVRLAQLGRNIEERRLPPIMKIGPSALPTDLINHLEQAGGTNIYRPSGMAACLAKIRTDFAQPAGLVIKKVTDSTVLQAWTALSSGLDFTLFRRLLSESNLRLYLGYLDGRAVATSMLFLSSGVAGIYFVSVVPECRNRGIGTAITLTPLVEARGMGYQVAVLQASTMGERIYRQIGFEEFFRFNYYQWKDCTYESFRDS
jgi:GNAT superfamily N-acetyltransferase